MSPLYMWIYALICVWTCSERVSVAQAGMPVCSVGNNVLSAVLHMRHIHIRCPEHVYRTVKRTSIYSQRQHGRYQEQSTSRIVQMPAAGAWTHYRADALHCSWPGDFDRSTNKAVRTKPVRMIKTILCIVDGKQIPA